MLLGLGEAERQAGDPEHRETLIAAADLAAEIGDTDLLVRAAIANNRGWSSSTGVVDEERVRVLRLALDRLGDVDTPERARLLGTLCAELLFGASFPTRLELADSAVAVARRAGDERTLLDTLIRTQESIVAPATLQQRRAWTSEACAIADRVDDPVMRGLAYGYSHLVAVEAADLERARQDLDVTVAEAAHIGQPTYQWMAAVMTAMDRAIAGDLTESEQTALRALQFGMDAGQSDATGAFGMQLLTIRFMQGRLNEMVPLLEQTLAEVPGIAALRSGLALGKTEGGELDEARQLLDAEAATDFERGMGSGWLASNAMWAAVAYRTGHVEAGQVLYDRLSPWSDQFISTHVTAHGAVAHPRRAPLSVARPRR